MEKEERAYSFDLTVQPRSIIKVVGVGGGGSNAVNYMFNQGFRNVEFVVCNTDAQALKTSPVPSKIQLGGTFLGGLGAGSIPENGREAAVISEESIKEMLDDGTKMVFITAGMGGGTGTGAAPVIAKVAKDLGILTIGIITKPFRFEGPRKNAAAEKGTVEMRQYCDTVIEIMNDRIGELFKGFTMTQAFAQADHVLSTSAKSLSEIITVPGDINVDFKDIETTMKNSGSAVMGSAVAKGDNRAIKAVTEAIASPLLSSNEIEGATKVLLAVTYGHAPELTIDEFNEITDYVSIRTGGRADVIFGTTMDPEMGDSIRVAVVATGFVKESIFSETNNVVELTQRSGVDIHFGQPQSPAHVPGPAVEPLPPGFGTLPSQQPTYTPTQHINPYDVAADYQPTQRPQEQHPSYQVPQQREEMRMPEQPKPAQPQPPTQPQVEQYQYVDINGNFQLMYQSPENVDRPLDQVDQLVSQRPDFAQQISRAEILRNLSAHAGPKPNYDDPDYLKKNEVPSYMRKNPNLMVHGVQSSENMSKYTMNENGEILDNNRFLHPKVD
jgi:cell division protein FtsZ